MGAPTVDGTAIGPGMTGPPWRRVVRCYGRRTLSERRRRGKRPGVNFKRVSAGSSPSVIGSLGSREDRGGAADDKQSAQGSNVQREMFGHWELT